MFFVASRELFLKQKKVESFTKPTHEDRMQLLNTNDGITLVTDRSHTNKILKHFSGEPPTKDTAAKTLSNLAVLIKLTKVPLVLILLILRTLLKARCLSILTEKTRTRRLWSAPRNFPWGMEESSTCWKWKNQKIQIYVKLKPIRLQAEGVPHF